MTTFQKILAGTALVAFLLVQQAHILLLQSQLNDLRIVVVYLFEKQVPVPPPQSPPSFVVPDDQSTEM